MQDAQHHLRRYVHSTYVHVPAELHFAFVGISLASVICSECISPSHLSYVHSWSKFVEASLSSEHMQSGTTIESCSQSCCSPFSWVPCYHCSSTRDRFISQAIIISSIGVLFATTATAPCMPPQLLCIPPLLIHNSFLSWDQCDPRHHRLLPEQG